MDEEYQNKVVQKTQSMNESSYGVTEAATAVPTDTDATTDTPPLLSVEELNRLWANQSMGRKTKNKRERAYSHTWKLCDNETRRDGCGPRDSEDATEHNKMLVVTLVGGDCNRTKCCYSVVVW